MWTRKELKDKAKAALKMNYWKAVLIVIIVMLVGEAMTIGGVSGNIGLGIDTDKISSQQGVLEKLEVFSDEFDSSKFNIGEGLASIIVMVLLLVGVGSVLATLIGSIFTLAYNILIVNPLAVGTRNFFSNSLESKGKLKDVISVFKKDYMNSVKIMLIMNIKLVLWALIVAVPMVIGSMIPGIGKLIVLLGALVMFVPLIIKMYEYMMIPYILSDNPDISTEAAFSESKRLMDGEKWNTFVLGLSFIGWNLLSGLTLGLLSIFFVAPYQCYTYAALYQKLNGKEAPFANKDYDEIFENTSGEALFEDM